MPEVRFTAPAKPPVLVMVMFAVPLAPCCTLSVVGATARLKSGAGLTVTLPLVVAVRLAPHPPIPWRTRHSGCA